jgi:hypothetical protein
MRADIAIPAAVAVAVFVAWTWLVAPVHLVETAIGLLGAGAAWIAARRALGRR